MVSYFYSFKSSFMLIKQFSNFASIAMNYLNQHLMMNLHSHCLIKVMILIFTFAIVFFYLKFLSFLFYYYLAHFVVLPDFPRSVYFVHFVHFVHFAHFAHYDYSFVDVFGHVSV